MVGKNLAGRYKLLEKVGEGGMARVYRSWDSLLNRAVAVKVLKEQMTGDSAFVKRFRREAQAAAGLSHPNIVNIYDVGEEDNIHFIVMEYLDGKNLKQYIREKGRLPAEEAVAITIRIAEALAVAHAAGVIHRDIKPQNIIFLNNGQVKVADFGIAIAADGTTLTCTDKIIGSVHYFSPEQARGSLAGKRSDLYSLGVVLYEMVTGQVPFKGESPVSVAMKHIQEPVIAPSQLTGDLSPPLERIILKAMQKDPTQRYLSAAEFLEDLRYFQREGESRAFSEEPHDLDDEDTRVMKPLPTKKEKGWAKKNWPLLTAIIFLSVALVTGFVLFYFYFLSVPEVIVPDLRSHSYEDALEILEENGLTANPEVFYVHDEAIPKGHVIKTSPSHGRKVRQNRMIDLYVSKGAEEIVAPDFHMWTEEEARSALRREGLKEALFEREYNSDVPEGKIYKQIPRAGSPLARDEQMILYVSRGERPFPLAGLTGRMEGEAVEYLRQEGLTAHVHYRKDKLPKGTVVEQQPKAGTSVQQGDSVYLVVSEGLPPEETQTGGKDKDVEEEEEEE
ncbi:MAG: Stk1 family PASTA domain-containing Ser/Thr kinase [Firmicutes bacterium]|nr:Stk1 family PASTA domain-containing Ser/Thr kinase [Bacillota bacterium]